MSATPAIDESQLPPQARRLVGALGAAGAMKLLKARGGTRIKLGIRDPDHSYLAELLGIDGLRKLLALYDGAPEAYLPKADKLLAQIRDSAIRREHVRGESLMTLALRYDLTTRHIQNIVGVQPQPREHLQQPELF